MKCSLRWLKKSDLLVTSWENVRFEKDKLVGEGHLFQEHTAAADARKEMEAGLLDSVSIGGYSLEDPEEEDDVLTFQDLRLREASLVTYPVDKDATVQFSQDNGLFTPKKKEYILVP